MTAPARLPAEQPITEPALPTADQIRQLVGDYAERQGGYGKAPKGSFGAAYVQLLERWRS